MASITFSEDEAAVLNEALNLATGFLYTQVINDPATSANKELLQQTKIRIELFDTLLVKIQQAFYEGPGDQSKVN